MKLTFFTLEQILEIFNNESDEHQKTAICPLFKNENGVGYCDCVKTKEIIGASYHKCKENEPCIVRVALSYLITKNPLN